MKKIAFSLLMAVLVMGCSNNDDAGDIPQEETTVASLTFSHTWEGQPVSGTDMSTTVYTNAHGEKITIERFRNLVSDIELRSENGDTYILKDYQLFDLSKPETSSANVDLNIPSGTYTLRFTHGFDEEDNIDGAYQDLNVASWNWPEMLGGGYHYLQFDGMYNVDTDAPMPFNFHNGLAKNPNGNIEQNYVEFEISGIEVTGDSVNLDIAMDIAEWFKNPNEWNLNELDIMLMPNYEAQIMMHENAATIFSASSITIVPQN